MFRTSVVYAANFNAVEKIVVNQGGTSSTKTYSVIQLLFTIAMSKPMQVITVVGQDIPNLKKGAYRDAKNIYHTTPELQLWFGKPNETERIFTCTNGSIIEFTSYQDEQDAKSGKRDYLFLNEANGIAYAIFRQLYLRTRIRTFIDYNPSARFWVHEHLIGRKDVKLIISDHRHNPFLSKEEHEKIESIDDPEFFKVYARGLTGVLQGLVYRNWQIVDEMPKIWSGRWRGLDFGFSNHPSVMLDVMLSNGELWVDELFYETGMLNEHIFDTAKENGVSVADEIIADSAEPKSIAELQNKGLRVEAAIKGPDSVKVGIDVLKTYKINITRRSVDTRKEIASYRWKTGSDGTPINEPIKFNDHAMDALRYVALNKLLSPTTRRGGKFKVTKVA